MIFEGLTPGRVRAEYLSAERYQECCNQIWSTDRRAGRAPDHRPPVAGSLVYAKADHTLPLFERLKKSRARVVLVTAESDRAIDEAAASAAPPQVAAWFSTNASAKWVRPLPLGLGNSYCQVTNKAPALAEALAGSGTRDKLLYVNFRPSSNAAVREPLLAAWAARRQENWVTVRSESVDPPDFLREMVQHKFVLCPAGNGIDSHRIWEALYTGTIPVVQSNPVFREFRDLPVMFVEDLMRVESDELKAFVRRSAGATENIDKMFLPFWTSSIRRSAKRSSHRRISFFEFLRARLPSAANICLA